MKFIPLSRGLSTIVDDIDFDKLNIYKWYALKVKHTFYAARKIKHENGNWGKVILMHRQILNFPNYKTDHVDRNGLNNQRENLRECTTSQNSVNSLPYNKTGFKGVYVDKRCKNSITARINCNKKSMYLGTFKTIEEAARAYNKAAIELFGEYAYLNTFNHET